VLGENGSAFVTDGVSSGDITMPGFGSKIVSLNISSGAVNWSYQVPAGNALSLVVASAGGGLVAKETANGVENLLRFDPSGGLTPDTWTASGISNYGGSLWLGSSGTMVSALGATPVVLSTSTWYGPDGNGGQSAKPNVTVSNFSQTGSNQTTITSVLQKIENALPNNATCNNWLQGSGEFSGISGLQQIQTVLGENNFGHGTMSLDGVVNYSIAAFSGGRNPDLSLIPGLPLSAAFFVNDGGSFFNQHVNGDQSKNFLVGKREYPGNSLRAQAEILTHETAHQIAVSGFQPDFVNKKAGKANDQAVDKNCRQLIEGLQ